MTVDSEALSKIAAPKSLEPCDTCFAVRGTISFSVALSIALAISWAPAIVSWKNFYVLFGAGVGINRLEMQEMPWTCNLLI